MFKNSPSHNNPRNKIILSFIKSDARIFIDLCGDDLLLL